MDARDHTNQQLYEILEDLLAKANKRKRSQSIESLERTNHPNQENELNESSLDKNPPIVPSNENVDAKRNQKVRSLKELLAIKENLVNMKEKLEENPRRFKQEITRLNRLEEKLNAKIRNAERREITYALDYLKKDPKRVVLQIVETKNKIEELKRKLEENPLRYKHEVERLNQLEERWQQKVDKTQSTHLKRAISFVEKNPKRHKEEFDKYQEIELKLKQGLERHQLDLSHDKKKDHAQEKTKEKQLDLQR